MLAAVGVALLLAATPAAAQTDIGDLSNEQFIAGAETQHPAGLYILAARLFGEGKREEAARWFYIGQLRYRFHLMANAHLPPDGDPALFASLSEAVGRPINEWVGGSVDGWIATIDHALEWDAAHANGFTSKSEHSDALAQVRGGLKTFRDSLDRDRETVRRTRLENGLTNRD